MKYASGMNCTPLITATTLLEVLSLHNVDVNITLLGCGRRIFRGTGWHSEKAFANWSQLQRPWAKLGKVAINLKTRVRNRECGWCLRHALLEWRYKTSNFIFMEVITQSFIIHRDSLIRFKVRCGGCSGPQNWVLVQRKLRMLIGPCSEIVRLWRKLSVRLSHRGSLLINHEQKT